MGDMADYYLDLSFDQEWHEQNDPDGWEQENDGITFSKSKTKTCRFCGTKGLSWVDTKYGWRLFDKNHLHACAQHKKPKG